jgi:hypothetical protein
MIMSDKIRLVYLDEEEGWQSIAHSRLKNDFQLHIPQYMPDNIEDIWRDVCEFDAQAVLIDYRLNDTGKVSYTGDDVIRELHRHNKHLPMFIITSYEDNALIECKEAQIIRGKELFGDAKQYEKLKSIITANVNNYNSRKASAEYIIKKFQDKVSKGENLTNEESATKFETELYLSELDLDNSVRSDLITSTSNDTLEELLKVAQSIVNLHKK